MAVYTPGQTQNIMPKLTSLAARTTRHMSYALQLTLGQVLWLRQRHRFGYQLIAADIPLLMVSATK